MNLQLSLITKYFIITNDGTKPEDYRAITAYWCNILLLWKGQSKPKIWWQENFFEGFPVVLSIDWLIKHPSVSFKPFLYNTMTLGYPKSNDTERIIKFEHAGIEIREGNPEWGAEPGKLYFVIKHGKRIN